MRRFAVLFLSSFILLNFFFCNIANAKNNYNGVSEGDENLCEKSYKLIYGNLGGEYRYPYFKGYEDVKRSQDELDNLSIALKKKYMYSFMQYSSTSDISTFDTLFVFSNSPIVIDVDKKTISSQDSKMYSFSTGNAFKGNNYKYMSSYMDCDLYSYNLKKYTSTITDFISKGYVYKTTGKYTILKDGNSNEFAPDELTEETIDNWDFDGFVFSYPRFGANEIRRSYTCNFQIAFNIPFEYDSNSWNEKVVWNGIVKSIKDSYEFRVDGKKLKSRKFNVELVGGDWLDVVEEYKKSKHIKGIIKASYDITDNGSHDISFYTNCLTGLDKHIFSLSAFTPHYTSYSCSTSFKTEVPVDEDGDGVDDETGKIVGDPIDNPNNEKSEDNHIYSADDMPKRSDYPDGILGSIEYGFDLLIYWITFPFKMIAKFFTNLFNSFEKAFSWVGQFTSFLGKIFSFLPSEIIAVVVSIVTVLGFKIILNLFIKR